jgi:hypothetical protein
MFVILVDSSNPREKPQTLARRSKEQDELEEGGIEDVIPLALAFRAMAFFRV